MQQKEITPRELKRFVAKLKKRDPKVVKEVEKIKPKPAASRGRESGRVLEGGLERLEPPREMVAEAIILEKGRPVLEVKNDATVVKLEDPESQVHKARLDAARPHLDRAIPAVGRIEVANFPTGHEWLGTGWLIEKDIIVTNRHVAAYFAQRDNAEFRFKRGFDRSQPITSRIDFLEELGSTKQRESPISDILWIAPDHLPDIAFLKLAEGAPNIPPEHIELNDSAPNGGDEVAVIGYPKRDSGFANAALMDRIFGDVYNKKRLAPGMITGMDRGEILHDCTTLGGNSGSVLFDLNTGKAAGLHFAGLAFEENYAVTAADVRKYLLQRPWSGQQVITESVGIDAGGETTVTIPLQITVRIGGGGPVS